MESEAQPFRGISQPKLSVNGFDFRQVFPLKSDSTAPIQWTDGLGIEFERNSFPFRLDFLGVDLGRL